MAEGEMHKHLKQVALMWLKFKCTDLVANEVKYYNAHSIADAVGINLKRREVRVIECKASKSDFVRDIKLFKPTTSYIQHANFAYIMCPTGIILPEEIPEGYGLLYVDEADNVQMIKKPVKNDGKLRTTFETSLKNTCRALTNTFLFHEDNKENKDETNNKFKRNAEIYLVAIKCPNCKKTMKELINKNKTKTIQCKCKHEIDLSKAKIREITGFNKTFINKINKLNE